MKVQNVVSPHAIPVAHTNEAASKARAVAAFNKTSQPPPQATTQRAEQSPVLNQNAVSPEELGAIKPQMSQNDPIEGTLPADSVAAEPPPKPEPTEAELAASRQFAQLARQEKALRAKVQQQETSIKAREDALKAREAELTAKDNQYKQGYYSKDQIKQDILSVMAEAGVSYDEVVQQVVNQSPQDPRMTAQLNALKAEIKVLRDAQDTSSKSYADQQTQAYESAVQQIRNDVTNLVKDDPNFETIRVAKAHKDVVELITETYKKDGILLSVEEAALEVENYLVDEALKFTRLDKIQKKLQAATQAASKPTQQTQATPAKPQTQPMKTLTNAASSSRQLSAKERAILAFKGELKS